MSPLIIALLEVLVLSVCRARLPEGLVVFEHFILEGKTFTLLALQVIAVKHKGIIDLFSRQVFKWMYHLKLVLLSKISTVNIQVKVFINIKEKWNSCNI